jgi:hypothetical protein
MAVYAGDQQRTIYQDSVKCVPLLCFIALVAKLSQATFAAYELC